MRRIAAHRDQRARELTCIPLRQHRIRPLASSVNGVAGAPVLNDRYEQCLAIGLSIQRSSLRSSMHDVMSSSVSCIVRLRSFQFVNGCRAFVVAFTNNTYTRINVLAEVLSLCLVILYLREAWQRSVPLMTSPGYGWNEMLECRPL